MRHLFSFATLLLAGAGWVSAAVDPALLSLLMPDAKIVAGVQVQQAETSALGQYLMSQMQSAAHLEALAQTTGFDPRRDVTEIVAASSGANRTGVLVARGFFQPQRIAAMAAAAGGTVFNYKGLDLIGANGGNGLVFLDGSTVAVGDVANLKGVIDRRGNGGQIADTLKQKAIDTSAVNDAWVVSVTPLGDLLSAAGAGNVQQLNMLQTVRQVAAGVKFGASTVKLTGEAVTKSNEDAQALADVMRFLASMVQARANGPDAARAAALVDAAKFSAEGSVMRLTLELPESQVEEMLQAPQRRNRAAVR
jgi:hypothetical protein